MHVYVCRPSVDLRRCHRSTRSLTYATTTSIPGRIRVIIVVIIVIVKTTIFVHTQQTHNVHPHHHHHNNSCLLTAMTALATYTPNGVLVVWR
jgi:hypothetical protein